MNETRKWFVAAFMVFLCVVMLVLTFGTTKHFFLDNRTTDSDSVFDKESPVSLADYSDEMPYAGSHTYGIDEYKILNNIVSEGGIITQYKMLFKNLKRRDYDIDSTYEDFDHDFAEYAEHLKGYLVDLKSMRPAVDTSSMEQEQTVEKVARLYNAIRDYRNHNTRLNDTLRYLDNCEYELSRVSAQMKLPIQ